VPHVLVTGGPGFIGRRVVRRFLDAGWQVTSLSLPGEDAMPDWGGRVEMAYGDLSDPTCISAVPGPIDTVVHLAAPVGLAGEYEHQWRVIAQGTSHICDAAARWRARLVVVSSIAVYGDKIRTQRCHEDDGHGAWSGAYGWAKQGQERLALEQAQRHGLKLTLVRPANVYGLGGASAWGDRFISSIRATGGGVLGDAERNNAGLVYVENLADALWLAATHPAAIGRTYNVCDDLDVTWRLFSNDMAALAGMPPPPCYPLDTVMALAQANEDPAKFVAPKDPAVPFLEGLNLVGFDNRIDSSRIRQELGWAPRWDYTAAMQVMKASL
jgi:nucleoside-diphosphate-sugar epimerase